MLRDSAPLIAKSQGVCPSRRRRKKKIPSGHRQPAAAPSGLQISQRPPVTSFRSHLSPLSLGRRVAQPGRFCCQNMRLHEAPPPDKPRTLGQRRVCKYATKNRDIRQLCNSWMLMTFGLLHDWLCDSDCSSDCRCKRLSGYNSMTAEHPDDPQLCFLEI